MRTDVHMPEFTTTVTVNKIHNLFKKWSFSMTQRINKLAQPQHHHRVPVSRKQQLQPTTNPSTIHHRRHLQVYFKINNRMTPQLQEHRPLPPLPQPPLPPQGIKRQIQVRNLMRTCKLSSNIKVIIQKLGPSWPYCPSFLEQPFVGREVYTPSIYRPSLSIVFIIPSIILLGASNH